MDPVHFTGREIVEMAIRIEENGMRFYADAAKATKIDRLKELFKALSEEEARHINLFTELKQEVASDSPAEGFDPYVAEATQYLKAMANTEVFKKPDEGEKLAGEVFDEKNALDIAIDREKDSIIFYYEMQKMIREKDSHVVENLIDQEKDHLKRLTEYMEELFGGS
jgi:rubrerythrin